MSSRQIFIFALFVIILWLFACTNPEVTETPTAVPPSPTSTSIPTATPEPTPTPLPWPPQVVYANPASGQELPLDGTVTIRFDQPMDRDSVESAFVFAPANDEESHLKGVFIWPRPDTVAFTPNDLNQQQLYRVRLDSQALGINKLPLRESFSLNVRTVGPLAVQQVIPTNNSLVAVDTAVTVIFNRAVVPLIPTDQQAKLPQPLFFDPPIEGRGEWLSTTIYRFSPDGPLPGGITYQVEIPASLTDLTGSSVAETYTWEFRTEAPRVIESSLGGGPPKLAPDGTITITFSTSMDTTTTEAAISLDPAAPGGLSFAWDDEHRVVAMTPQRPLPLATVHDLIVAKSAQAADGQSSLAAEYRRTFRTYPYPAIIATTPTNGRMADEWFVFDGGPRVEFAGPMDPESFANRIIVQPPPDDLDYTYREFAYNPDVPVKAFLDIHFNQAHGAQYTVTVQADVADHYGNTLGEDYTFTYTTPDYPPLLHLNLPGNVGHLSRSFPSAVDLIYRNISQAQLDIYDAGLPFGILFDSYNNLPVYMPGTEPLRSWTFTNTAVLNEATIQNIALANGGVLPNGVYFVEAQSPEIPEPERWQKQRAVFIVADTSLMVKQTYDALYIWATDIATGLPVAGRTITVYNEREQPQGTAVTDENGFATIPYISPGLDLQKLLLVSNAPGQSGFGLTFTGWFGAIRGANWGQQERPYAAYFYTDRPIYRPGDTVYFRGIVRDTNYGRYNPTSLTTLPMIVESWANYQDEATDLRESFTLDKNGAFTGQFVLPDDMPVGSYFLNIEDFDIAVQISFNSTPGVFFEVADYRKPELQVTVTPEQPQALMGEEITAAITATYFFGSPAANMPVQWAVCNGRGATAQNYCSAPEPTGEGVTDNNGQITIPVPNISLPNGQNNQWMTIMAVVSGVGELPVAGFSTVRLHTAETLAQIKPVSYVNRANQEMRLNVTTTDWDNKPMPAVPVAVTIVHREWTGGGYYTWKPVDTPVATIAVTTDELGYAPVSFTPPMGGSYVVTAVATDPAGRPYTTTTSFYASDPSTIWRGSNGRNLTLVADQDNYKPGDTARILVQSPFTETVSAWLTIERGVTVEQQLITLNGSSQIVEIPITSEYAPNVYVTITAVRGTNENRQFAEATLGIVNLPVSTEQLELSIALTPQETQLAPGDTVTYDITITDYLGRPVQANLSLALVDLAVLSLKPDNSRLIQEVFYAQQAYRSKVGSGLFISAEGLPINIPEQMYGGGGGGDGGIGLSGQDAYGLEEDARRDFPDTAYWEGNITTDENGRASVTISLPDSTTTWRLSSKAVSLEGTLVGQTSTDVVVTKPLLIQPLTPRFFTFGDQVVLGATLHNNTEETLNGTVGLDASGVTLLTEAEQSVSIAPGERAWVQWPVRVEDVEFVDLTFFATAGQYNDATKPTFGIAPNQLIPVIHYEAVDVVGASGVLTTTGEAVEAIYLPETVANGEVIFQLTPSLAATLVEALEFTGPMDDRYACAHELGNRLLANVAVLRALEQLEIENNTLAGQLDSQITADLHRLFTLVKSDGGWGWCGSKESDPILTASIILAVLHAQTLGYTNTTFSNADISQTMTYLDGRLRPPASLQNSNEITRQAFLLYVLAHYKNVIARLDGLYNAHPGGLSPHAKALMVLAYRLNEED
ncbi:MAG TPA: Ig-like domain-containing protein, partial [Chloroflexota bacterium]|nr:Ig-like domain-containing protein [Chloroflexota bacterium]